MFCLLLCSAIQFASVADCWSGATCVFFVAGALAVSRRPPRWLGKHPRISARLIVLAQLLTEIYRARSATDGDLSCSLSS